MLTTSAHFDDIPAQIARQLRAAGREIIVAVAWFTAPALFDALCQQVRRGLRVRLAILDDPINVGPGRLDFRKLQDIGAEVYLIPTAGRDAIMHHKFCIIDSETVIVGSYNWTNRARENDESIVIIAGANELANDYRRAFESLLERHQVASPGRQATPESVIYPLSPSEHRSCLDLISTHPDVGRLFVGAVSRGYPCSETLIDRYVERWNWDGLSFNPWLSWTETLIKRYSRQWNWGEGGLSLNHEIPWNEALIERYETRWEWGALGLSGNQALPWSTALIERYVERWDWGRDQSHDGLSGNKSLPWSEALLRRYVNKWAWGILACSVWPMLLRHWSEMQICAAVDLLD